MITWIQTVLQKHNKVLFSALLIIVTVTFVLTIGNQSFFGSGTPQQYRRMDFFGFNLKNSGEVNYIQLTAEVSSILHPERQVSRQRLVNYGYDRIAALFTARQLGIQEPGKQEVEAYIKSLPVFQDENGKFDADGYSSFFASLDRNARYSKSMVVQTLKDDYRIDKVLDLLGGAGYVLPYEAKQQYLETETEWTISTAAFSAEDFNPEITVDEATLKAFYDNAPSVYQEPQKMQAKAVLFKTASFIEAGAEADDAAQAAAKEAATAHADDFTVALWRRNIEKDSEAFNKAVAEFGGEIVNVPAFSASAAPAGTVLPATLFANAWSVMDETRYYSDLGVYADGAAVLIREGMIEANIPPFEAVRDAVLARYSAQEKHRLFLAEGNQLQEELQAAVMSGKDFKAAAESLGMKAEDYPAFTQKDMPPVILYTLYDVLNNTGAGDVSEMTFRGNAGILVYVKSKQQPSLAGKDAEIAAYTKDYSKSLKEAGAWLLIEEVSNKALAQYNDTQGDAE